MPEVWTCPQFIQLTDDDIVSLTALTLIVNPACQNSVHINNLTLTLYLMTKCQSMSSLPQTLNYIEVTWRIYPVDRTLDHWTLELAEREVLTSPLKIMHRAVLLLILFVYAATGSCQMEL